MGNASAEFLSCLIGRTRHVIGGILLGSPLTNKITGIFTSVALFFSIPNPLKLFLSVEI